MVIEDLIILGNILAIFNLTFITLIPKCDYSENLQKFKPISLYNFVYNIIEKIIAIRIKGILSVSVSQEQLSFLAGRQIHDAISTAQ